MLSFYDNFISLCKQKSVSPSVAVKSIGLGTPNATYWKRGSLPKLDTVIKLAEYFDVSLGDLMSKEEIIKSITGKNKGSFVELPTTLVIEAISNPPESVEDQIVYFYSKLNNEGKQAAAVCFFRHMKEEDREIVRDYIKNLSETPQFQQLEEEPDTPIDTSADDEKPDKE